MPESLAAQRIEASKAVGKDEVGSSNLPSSSNEKALESSDLSAFSLLLQLLYYFRHSDGRDIFIETHTETHTDS